MTDSASFAPCPVDASAKKARRLRGARSYLSGLAAEDQVAAHYEAKDMPVVLRRWRGSRGEIDLIARDGAIFVFIEVKQSRTHDRAASHLGPAQMRRLWSAAEEFLALSPRGSLTEIRFDLAMVDGQGQIEILPNIFQ